MRSAETSGVKEEGFRPVVGEPTGRRSISERLRNLPPAAWAIAAVAIIAALLSILVDLDRSVQDHHRQRAALSEFSRVAPELLALMQAELDLSGVWQRGAAALALAGLIAGLALRRRPQPPVRPGVNSHELMGSIPFGVACWTRSGELIACNEQYRARLNLRPGDLKAGATYPLTARHLLAGGYSQLLRENEDNRLIELRRDDGSCLLIDERPLGQDAFITLVSDVTEERRTDQLLASIREEQRLLARRYHEQKLKAEVANRAKTVFLAHLSHDIRTPLNHIIGFAELMRQQTYGALGDRRYLNYVEAMKASGERLLSYFAAILELAELESGRRPQRLERIDVDDLLLGATRRFSGQANRGGLTLQLGQRCDATILGDRPALERMLGNLIENALRFTPKAGRVTLAGHAATDGVVLEITDTGVGIPEHKVEMLSQPFAFSDAVLTREQSGAGLGIAIARAIAEANGGRLAIDSCEGVGTTVAISLPLDPAAMLSIAQAAA